MQRLYFDYNATTPLAPVVRDRLIELTGRDEKNPSSVHADGREARKGYEHSRQSLAHLLDCHPSEICITSGATESNNSVFYSVWKNRSPRRNKILSTATEHDSVFKPLKRLEEKGAEIVWIKVDRSGGLDWDSFLENLDERTLLVSMMLANNETGISFPVERMVPLARQVGALVHTDAACAVGKMAVSFSKLGIDFLSLSAHKFYGPKGVGALLVKKGGDLEPLLLGGGQESNRRAGTENSFGMIGMATALEYALEDLPHETERLSTFRKKIKKGIFETDSSILFHESSVGQLPGTLNVAFPGLSGQTLLARLDLEGVSVSYGSACSSGTLEVSRALLAMGIPEDEAKSSIRISFGKMTTEEEVGGLIKVFARVIPEMR